MRVALSDVLLYYLARLAQENEQDGCNISAATVQRAMHEVIPQLRDSLVSPVIFEKNHVFVFSNQVDDAIRRLTPFDVHVVPPSFKLHMTAAEAKPRLDRVAQRVPPGTMEKLQKTWPDFRQMVSA